MLDDRSVDGLREWMRTNRVRKDSIRKRFPQVKAINHWRDGYIQALEDVLAKLEEMEQ